MKEPTLQEAFDDPELRSHVRAAVLSILAIAVFFLMGGIFFEKEIHSFGQYVFSVMGLPGLSLLIFLGDSVVTPIPPDVALIIIKQADLGEQAYRAVTILGVVSVFAGFTGWSLGLLLRRTRLPRWIFGPKLDKAEIMMKRYGPIAVSVGALTPIPYSITTWTAGMFGLRFRRIILPTLLRIPRFWLYYWILDGAFRLGAWF